MKLKSGKYINYYKIYVKERKIIIARNFTLEESIPQFVFTV